MNYLELITKFWKLDLERPFTASDTRLYFYLVHTCNTLGWKNPFGHSDRHLALNVSVSVNTIRKAKHRLVEAGLIHVAQPDKPSNSTDGQTKYTLLTVSKNDTASKITVSKNDTVCDTVGDTVGATNTKIKETETKEKIKQEFEIFHDALANKFPNVSKLESQMTFTEYRAVIKEFSLHADELNNILQRMENYKPLLAKSTSVYLTLRSWLLNDQKSNTYSQKKFSKTPEPLRKQTPINEGITL